MTQNNIRSKSKIRLWVIIAIVLCLILGGGYILKQFNLTNNKDTIVELTPDFIKAIQKYDELDVFNEGYAAVCKDGKWGFINIKGEEIIQCIYSKVNPFHEGYAAVCKDERWGCINAKGEEIVPCQYSNVNPFSEGYAAVCKYEKDEGVEKWGYVNTKGEEVIPCQYADVGSFNEGYASVAKFNEYGEVGKWGYVNTKGQEIIPANIEATLVGDFSEGLAFVLKDANSFYVIDTKGNAVFSGYADFSYSYTVNTPRYFHGELYVPTAESKSSVYDRQGNKIKETDYYACNINEKEPYLFFGKENGNFENCKYWTVGLKSANDKEIIPAIYESINGNGGYPEYPNQVTPISVSNGVVLVALRESDSILGTEGDRFIPDGKLHYGYADLNGNDTFSAELKKRCKEAYEKMADMLHQQYLEEQERLRREGPDWLQGAWRLRLTDDYGRHLGYMYEVFNHGTSKTYANGSLISERNYTVSDDMVMYDNNGYYQLDSDRQIVVSADGQKMQKVSNDTSYSPTSYSSSRSYSNNINSNSRSHRFTSPQDVIGYLSDKTFYNGSLSLQIRTNGIWVDGRCLTGAPMVERWKSWKALIRANSITGGRTSLIIDPINGEIIDSGGNVFKLR